MLLVDRKTISMKITSSILLLFIGISSYAQDCDCLTELRFLAEQAQEAPSMKSQRRSLLGKLAFIAEIEEDMQRDENIDLNCLFYLQRYLKVVKDEHMYIADLSNTKDYAALTPVYEESPEALTSNAVTTKDDPITGIYDLLRL